MDHPLLNFAIQDGIGLTPLRYYGNFVTEGPLLVDSVNLLHKKRRFIFRYFRFPVCQTVLQIGLAVDTDSG